MRKKVFAYLKKWHMVRPGMRILTGFSGGADSTALLQLLWEYGQACGISVCAVHVNHGIRGEEAVRDQRFCEAFCREREIPLKIVCKDVPRIARAQGISLEEAGRNARYEVFEKELHEKRADRVALAHHQNDQAETILFHQMRGTGLRGLRGMEPVRLPYIRPFLCVTKEEIVEWLQKEGLTWVEDTSNQAPDYTRNQIRHRVLSAMEEIRPGSAARMAGMAEQLLEIEDFLKQETLAAFDRCVCVGSGEYRILLPALERLHPALQKQVALTCLERVSGKCKDLESIHVEQVLLLAGGKRGSRVTLPGGCVAVLGYGELLLKKGYGLSRTEEEIYCMPDDICLYMGSVFSFRLEERKKDDEIPVNRYTKWFDYDKIKDSVVLRTRRPGDYLEHEAGAHKKLKDYLIDNKIPREERDQCILLADGSHILWVVGMRISERYKVRENTKRILKVQMTESGGAKDG